MSSRVIGITAVAALVLAAGLIFLGRGGHDSSAALLTTATQSAAAAPRTAVPDAAVPRATTRRPAAARPVAAKIDARTRLTASSGPYRNPFAPPADVTIGKAGGAAANGQEAAPPAALQATSSSPTPAQGTPGGGEVPPHPGGPAAGPSPVPSPSGQAPSPPTPSPSPAATPTPSGQPVAILRLVIPGHDPQTAAAEARDMLPSLANPLLAVIRVVPDRRQAVLLLAAGVHPEGEGDADCAPSGERCRMLTMAVGDVQPLESTSQVGRQVHYRLLLVDVR